MVTQASVRPVGVQQGSREGIGYADLRVPGFLFFLEGAAFLTVSMLAASMAPGYDFNAAAISDLGVIEGSAVMFNGLLVAVGLLNIAAGYLFFLTHRRPLLLAIYVISGVGSAGAGLVPLDVSGLHSVFAFVAFLSFDLEAIATARWLRGPMRTIAVVAGTIGLVYLVLMVIGDAGNPVVFGSIGHGGSERMIAYPSLLWLIAFGGYLMATPAHRAPG